MNSTYILVDNIDGKNIWLIGVIKNIANIDEYDILYKQHVKNEQYR